MAQADVTIYGAGIFGLTAAFCLVKRGAQVQVIDPGGVAAGSSGGIVGALAPHTPENWNEKKAFQFESLSMAGAFWAEVAEISDVDPGYVRAGRLQPIPNDAALVLATKRAETARTLWQGKAIWEVLSEDQFTPWVPHSPTGLVIRDTLSAHIHPRQATHALAKALTALGGTIVAQGREQGQVLWATGYQGLESLSQGRARMAGTGVKGQAALFAFDAKELPQLFADTLHIVPHLDGTVAIGSTSEREYTSPDTTDAQLEDIIDRVRRALPQLRDAPVIERWAGVRPRARSRGPMLGAYPDRPGHFIANGGFKIGFGMAPKMGQVMADLILEGRDQIPEGFKVAASL